MAVRAGPYVPRLVLEWARDVPEERYRTIEGTLVFADVSGFTAMSERLATLGRLGAEELTHHLNDIFSQLLDVAALRGGSLLKFGGDALLLFFWGDEHAARGVAAAAEMRAKLRQVGRRETSAGTVRLRMSMGAHTGTVDFFLVGDPHRDLIVSGPAATTVVAMEGIADAGEIVLSPELASRLSRAAQGPAKEKGVLLARAPRPRSDAYVTLAPADVDAGPFLSAPLRDFLAAGAEAEGEHRWLAIAFCHVDGVDEALRTLGPEVATAELEQALGALQRALASAGVCQLDCDVYKGGPKVLAVAGAPYAHENDSERLLRALLDAHEHRGRLTIRSGTNYGTAFVGPVGPDYRRAYTVMGDAVNTAARVMAHARPGEVLALESMTTHTEVVFESAEGAPFMAKGKSEPLTPYTIGPPTGQRVVPRSARIPFVGREAELAELRAMLDGAVGDAGRVVEITAPPGGGKTRLVEEFLERSAVTSLRTVNDEYRSAVAFAGARPLLLQALGVEGVPAAEVRGRLVALSPAVEPWLPLVGTALGLDLGRSDEVDALDPQFAGLRLAVAVGALLLAAHDDPLVWFVDDGQWMDEASTQLVRRLCQAVSERPWLVCITRRPVDGGLTVAGAAPMALGALGDEASANLVRSASGDRLLPVEVQAIVERAGGNPLFLRDLALAKAEGGELPDTLETLIASRIDRLDPERRNVIRLAAVLGPSFEVDLLERLAPGWRIAGLEDFVDLVGTTMQFRHRLDQETAYRGMSFQRRRELHRLAGEQIEASTREPLEQAAILSLHFSEAREWPRAWTYSIEAGRRARAAYADLDAAASFARAVDAAAHLSDLPQADRASAWQDLTVAYYGGGRYADAVSSAARGTRALRGDPIAVAQMAVASAEARTRLGEGQTATRALRRAARVLRSLDGEAAAGERARVLNTLAHTLLQAGFARQARRCGEEAIADAARSGDERALALSYAVMTIILPELGAFAEAEGFLEIPLEAFERFGALRQLGSLQNQAAIIVQSLGEWDAALEWLDRSQATAARVGDLTSQGLAALNRSLIMIDQGRLDDAADAAEVSAGVFTSLRYRAGLALIARVKGRISFLLGDPAAGEAQLAECIEGMEAVGLASYATRARADLAELLALTGSRAQALELAAEVIDSTIGDGEDGARHARALRGRAIALDDGRRRTERDVALGEALRAAGEDPFERALTSYVRASFDAADDAELADMREVFARLGVVWVPPVPGGRAVEIR